MQRLLRDIRYALRQLRNAPGFTITALLTLALGIGANASIFTLVNAILLRTLPVADTNTLVRIGDNDDCCINGGVPDNNNYAIFAYDLYRYIQDNTPEFTQLAAMQANTGSTFTVRRSGTTAAARASRAEFVSGNYFTMFGLQPAAGRLLVPSDDREGAPNAVVMSYQAWERDYALAPDVVGSTFTINTHAVTVVGVAPKSFYGDRMSSQIPDFYLPMALEPILTSSSILHRHDLNWVYIMGHVKPGVNLGSLQAKVSGSVRQWLADLPLYKKAVVKGELPKTHVVLTRAGVGIGNMQQEYEGGLHLLMGISALVLLIACANIANLVLVRGLARRAETSIRMALGAQRAVLIRQMLTESVVLACLGGLAGLIVAYVGTHALLATAFPSATASPIQASPSPMVLGFAFALSLLTGLVFGVAPAWITSHSDPADALRGSNRSTRDSSSLLQRALVIFQAALSLVLLVAAGMLTRSLNRLEHQDFGIERENRVVVHINPFDAGFQPTQLQALYDELHNRFHAIPGVRSVGLVTYTPLEGDNWGEGVYIQGRPEPGRNDNIGASWARVDPEFLSLVGQRLVHGRYINAQDTATTKRVAVVNQAFVKRFFKDGQDPIGVHFGTSDVKSSNEIEIVGVVSDAKYNNVRHPVRAMFFRPLLQQAPLSDGDSVRSLYIGAIMLKLDRPVEGLESQVRSTLSSINPNLTVIDYATFDQQISGLFNQERLIARLTLMFGVLALILAAVGLYGVTSYLVARRTAEIGIRMALGAARSRVVGDVMREALLQALIGLCLGVPVVLLCVRFIESQLYEVSSHDTASIALSITALAVSAFVAGLVPALRAASTDPVKALRTE